MPRISIQNFRDTYEEIAKKYDLSPEEIEPLFLQALERFYNNEVYISGDGIVVGGRYRNIKYRDFQKIMDIFQKVLLEESSKRIKDYIIHTVSANDEILYAKLIKERHDRYIMQPYLSKNNPMPYLTLSVLKQNARLPQHIEYIPVHIKLPPFKKEPNRYRAIAFLMNRKMVNFHLDLLKRKIEKRLEKTVDLSFIAFGNKEANLILLHSETLLTKAIIEYIKRYFSSFGISVSFVKQRNDMPTEDELF